MALSIDSVVRINGAQCDHFRVTGTRDGVQVSMDVSGGEIDSVGDLSAAEADKLLALLWIRHRRAHGRSVTGQISN